MASNSKSNSSFSGSPITIAFVAFILLTAVVGVIWAINVLQTRSTIARINSEGVCSVQRTASGSSYVIELSLDDVYNLQVLETLSHAYFGIFTELTISGITSKSIPSTQLGNVSEVYVIGEVASGNDVARLAVAFPNCHIWKFDSLHWTEQVQIEIGNFPIPSAVFVSTKAPEGVSAVTSVNQTSVFWN